MTDAAEHVAAIETPLVEAAPAEAPPAEATPPEATPTEAPRGGRPTAEVRRAESRCTAWSRNGWMLLGASVQGSSHMARELPCQDAHFVETAREDVLVIAVADGAGSAPRSDEGAVLAARRAVESVCASVNASAPQTTDWPSRLTDAVTAAREAVVGRATELEVPVSDLACTLLICAVTGSGAYAAQIGDGAIVIADDSGSLRMLTQGQKGEFFNETVFVTHPGATADIAEWSGAVGAVALLSDGLEPVAIARVQAEPHAGFFRPLFNYVSSRDGTVASEEGLLGFLESPKIRERADDDLTLVMAVRRHSSSGELSTTDVGIR